MRQSVNSVQSPYCGLPDSLRVALGEPFNGADSPDDGSVDKDAYRTGPARGGGRSGAPSVASICPSYRCSVQDGIGGRPRYRRHLRRHQRSLVWCTESGITAP